MMIKLSDPRVDTTGYSLIVPAVAVGNVAQLAVDLLIYNGDMKKIGQLASPDFIPFLGADPYDEDSTDICTTADFYINREKRIIALQIRSPATRFDDRLDNFFEKLGDFVKERKISKVIILTSKWQFVRIDAQLRSDETMRYVASSSMEPENEKIFREFGWKKLEEATSDRLEIRGGGFAPSLFEFLSGQKIPCVLLLKFSSEGNNAPDAKELANFFNRWISLVPAPNEGGIVHWKEPPSWRHTFGPEAPPQIY